MQNAGVSAVSFSSAIAWFTSCPFYRRLKLCIEFSH
jgi:hypothetical protein